MADTKQEDYEAVRTMVSKLVMGVFDFQFDRMFRQNVYARNNSYRQKKMIQFQVFLKI